jgi:hypothetical protein
VIINKLLEEILLLYYYSPATVACGVDAEREERVREI